MKTYSGHLRKLGMLAAVPGRVLFFMLVAFGCRLNADIAPQAEVKASAWVRKGKAIVVVVNLGDEKEARVKIDFARLGFTPGTIRNYESKAVLAPRDDGIRLKIPRHDYQLLWIE